MKYPWFIWISRVLVILVSLFAILYSFDFFEGYSPLGQKLPDAQPPLGFVLVVWLALILTWRRPRIAGIVFSAVALAIIALYATHFREFFRGGLLTFGLPLLIAVALFFLAHIRRVKS